MSTLSSGQTRNLLNNVDQQLHATNSHSTSSRRHDQSWACVTGLLCFQLQNVLKESWADRMSSLKRQCYKFRASHKFTALRKVFSAARHLQKIYAAIRDWIQMDWRLWHRRYPFQAVTIWKPLAAWTAFPHKEGVCWLQSNQFQIDTTVTLITAEAKQQG